METIFKKRALFVPRYTSSVLYDIWIMTQYLKVTSEFWLGQNTHFLHFFMKLMNILKINSSKLTKYGYFGIICCLPMETHHFIEKNLNEIRLFKILIFRGQSPLNCKVTVQILRKCSAFYISLCRACGYVWT